MQAPKFGACSQCRHHKTRCLLDESHPGICQRCHRLGHPCTFTPHSRRRTRVATNARVAELERNLSALHALLNDRAEGTVLQVSDVNTVLAGDGLTTDMNMATSETDESEEPSANINLGQNLQVTSSDSLWSSTVKMSANQTRSDENSGPPKAKSQSQQKLNIIQERWLTAQEAQRYLEQYRTELYPHFPIVYIPSTVTADELQKTKPMLFTALIAAVAGKTSPDLAAKLDKKVLEEYATRCLVNSEKSLELVQALLLSAIWFQPPNRLSQLKFNDYIRMAATMSMDMGIATPSSKRRTTRLATRENGQSLHPLGHVQKRLPTISIHNLETDEIINSRECKRTLLAIYTGSANIGITLRRPPIMRLNRYMWECIEELDQNQQAILRDRELAAWCRLFSISDEISNSFSHDDLDDVASILDLKTQLLLKAFDDKLIKWMHSALNPDTSPSLRMTYFAIRIFLFEIVLHLDYPPEDFKAPFQMSDVTPSEPAKIPMKPVVEAISQLIASSHALLDVFLNLSIDSARALPVFCWIRTSSAIFVIAKLSMSCSSKNSRLRSLTDQSAIKADFYMERSLLRMRDIMGSDQYRVPAIFTVLLSYIRQRCTQSRSAMETETNDSLSHSLRTSLNDSRYEKSTSHTAAHSSRNEAARSPSQLEGLLPGITATSRVRSSSGNYAKTASPAATTQADSHESPWSQSMDDVDWQGNVLSFPGGGVPLGYNDHNGLMSCPTQ